MSNQRFVVIHLPETTSKIYATHGALENVTAVLYQRSRLSSEEEIAWNVKQDVSEVHLILIDHSFVP